MITKLNSDIQSDVSFIKMENFIPLKPEYLSRDWLAMVINHYREIKQLSPIRWVEPYKIVTTASFKDLLGTLLRSSHHR